LAEVVNVFEMRAVAERKLSDQAFAMIGGTDRRALERITFRPRLMVNVTQLDLTTELLGQKMFTPVIVGPVSWQQTFYPDGEVATAQGASAARTTMIVSSRSSRPLADIVAAATTPLWYQIYPDADIKATIDAAQKGIAAGCKAVCLTVGAPYQKADSGRLQVTGNVKLQWPSIQELKRTLKAPLILKGIMNSEEARTAAEMGIDAVVVSNHGGMFTTGFADPIEMLPLVAEAVRGKIPILIDGGFRRGTDVLKALALGARAVLVGRPVIWGLAAYGSEGVRVVLEMLQTELGRSMAMCGKPDVKSVARELVRIHKR
jgi:4-hydroxymandelate oxidase